MTCRLMVWYQTQLSARCVDAAKRQGKIRPLTASLLSPEATFLSFPLSAAFKPCLTWLSTALWNKPDSHRHEACSQKCSPGVKITEEGGTSALLLNSPLQPRCGRRECSDFWWTEAERSQMEGFVCPYWRLISTDRGLVLNNLQTQNESLGSLLTGWLW